MDALKEIFYFIYVIHQNAFITLGYFVMTNVAFVILMLCMLYVFNFQNTFVEKETLRPLRRQMTKDPYRMEQGRWGGLDEDIILSTLSKERLTLIRNYAIILALILICFFFATRVVLYMITMMWIVGVISVYMLKGDRKEMADNIEKYSMGYCAILIVLKIMIQLVIGTPMSEWSRSLGVALPASAMGTLSGYLPMMFLIITIGTPLMYLKTVGQRYSIAKDNEDVVKRRGEIMRTSNQDMLNNYQEDFYKTQKW